MKSGLCLLGFLLLGSSVTGCASRNSPPPEFCAVAVAIYVGEEDVLSDKTADQILEHNMVGKRLCHWGE